MVNTPRHPEDIRQAAVEDYRTSGDTLNDVAARHAVGLSTLGKWVRQDDGTELAYRGGWENVGGIMRPLFPERRGA